MSEPKSRLDIYKAAEQEYAGTIRDAQDAIRARNAAEVSLEQAVRDAFQGKTILFHSAWLKYISPNPNGKNYQPVHLDEVEATVKRAELIRRISGFVLDRPLPFLTLEKPYESSDYGTRGIVLGDAAFGMPEFTIY